MQLTPHFLWPVLAILLVVGANVTRPVFAEPSGQIAISTVSCIHSMILQSGPVEFDPGEDEFIHQDTPVTVQCSFEATELPDGTVLSIESGLKSTWRGKVLIKRPGEEDRELDIQGPSDQVDIIPGTIHVNIMQAETPRGETLDIDLEGYERRVHSPQKFDLVNLGLINGGSRQNIAQEPAKATTAIFIEAKEALDGLSDSCGPEREQAESYLGRGFPRGSN